MVVPLWQMQIAEWLEQECNAIVIMDMYSDCPYSYIDPSNEESIFRGMARRNLIETPMIRTSRGTVDIMINDITRLVNFYDIDVVLGPGHMGHKDMAASYGILNEVCKSLNVPMLYFNYDLFDIRHTPMDQIKSKFLQFFDAMGLR